MKKKINANTTAHQTTAVTIEEWWATQPMPTDVRESVAVLLQDGRFGLLRFDLYRTFDGSEDWCELDAIGKGGAASPSAGSARYGASQIGMSQKLRQHILRAAFSASMTVIADQLAELRHDIPEFSAYVTAEGMKDGSCEAEEVTDLADRLSGIDSDGVEEAIPNLRRLASECGRLWPKGRDMERQPSTHGLGGF